MKPRNFWGKIRSQNAKGRLMIAVLFALVTIIGGVVLGLSVTRGNITAASAKAAPPTAAPANPVSKIWYFAEGRVGKGFREYITIDNPNTVACSVDVHYLYTPDGGASVSKTIAVSVPASSRVTQSANTDLSVSDSAATGDSVASILSVSQSTANCPGVVAERPVYFRNFNGISSGTDVLGATHLGNTFYFADVPSDTNNTSYLTILNPGKGTASVTATYYAGGKTAGTQKLTVAGGSRGTIAPKAITLPGHQAAVISSNAPIIVERPTYFTNINGQYSGASDIVGTPVESANWLFAEGLTDANHQESLSIANTDPTNTVSVKIVLASAGGTIQTFPVTVNAQSQLIWNVNSFNTFKGSTPQVSAEVIGETPAAGKTAAKPFPIVVQREIYFHYTHDVNGQKIDASGGTDVMGLSLGDVKTAYSFAEGYTINGYNEWLTLVNLTANSETITVTLSNALGKTNTQNYTIAAHSRTDVDITALASSLIQANNSPSAQISMTVQTSAKGAIFMAERVMYWNTNGFSSFVTTGGTDIFGYNGL